MRQRDLLALKAEEARKKDIDLDPPRCEMCSKVIPAPRRYNNNVKFCGPEHMKEHRLVYQRERNARLRLERHQAEVSQEELDNGLYPEQAVRRGPLYDQVKAQLDSRVLEDWIDHKYTDVEVRKMLGKGSFSGLGMVRKALFNDRLLAIASSKHSALPTFAKMLGPPDKTMRELRAKDKALYERKLDDLVKAFVSWRNHFFQNAQGVYITKPVHERWIRSILDTIYSGGRSLILSPPRHGKTELLIHFCVWLILRNSNIRILWIGPNGDIAENCLGLVKDILENNDDLAAAYLAPGQTWSPLNRRSGNLWQSDKFTVQTRTIPQKQPTMWAAGVGGKILSLDADFIVVDDPADPDESYTEGGRNRIYNWFRVKVISRKMDWTGLAVIASRVHIFDLHSNFIDHHLWNVVVDKAHDSGICGLDLTTPHPGDGVKEGCVLFPEMNPLRYLREQQSVVGDALFEMMYLNQPRPDGTLIFDPDIIRLRCLHPGRDLGTQQIVGKYRLVAGLDPAAKGVQAAFLWAVQEYIDPVDQQLKFLYHMVDIEATQGGGLEGAERVMRDWLARYNCNLWVVEDNAFQSVFFTDIRFRRFLNETGIIMRGANTGQNRNTSELGVSSMATDYHEGRVILPYATIEARKKVDQLIRQLIRWTGEGRSKAGTSDILMASWFPHVTVIRRWKKEAKAAHNPQPPPAPSNSYPDYNEATFPDMPWEPVGYPQNG